MVVEEDHARRIGKQRRNEKASGFRKRPGETSQVSDEVTDRSVPGVEKDRSNCLTLHSLENLPCERGRGLRRTA